MIACPDPLKPSCGWTCLEARTRGGDQGAFSEIEVNGTTLVRIDYQNWNESFSTTNALVELVVSASDSPSSKPAKAPDCLTLRFASGAHPSDGLVPDLFWAQSWLDWFIEAISAGPGQSNHKVLAEVPPADETFCHRWLSLVRALCDERSLEFSVLGLEGQASGYNSYLAKPRKGCCRLPSKKL